VSLLTGVPACTHGVRTASDRLAPTQSTLADQLGAAGYTTAAFTDGGGMVPETGLGRGFDVYVELSGVRSAADPEGSVSPFTTALEWLATREDEPTFIFVHTSRAWSPDSEPNGAALQRYEESVRALDERLRDFVVKSDRLVDPDRSILVVTSAHGEEFLEHGARGHGTQLFDESIRIPLLMRGPGLKAGTRVTGSVGQIDIASTLLQLCGLAALPGSAGRGLGDSLLSRSPIENATRFVEAKAPLRETATGPATGWSPPAYAVVDGTHKLVREVVRRSERAYDVATDPNESRDLLAAGVAPAWAAPLRSALDAHIATCRSAPVQERASDSYLTPDSRMRLRALGYRD
jgi:arylsulfatase A-like enzyme